MLYNPPVNAGCSRSDILANTGWMKKGGKITQKTPHSPLFHSPLNMVSCVIGDCTCEASEAFAPCSEHGRSWHSTRYDTSTSWLWFSKRESGGWSPWHHLMNTARPAGGTKCIRWNFNLSPLKVAEWCTFCSSKTEGEATFQRRRCHIPALSQGSNKSFELQQTYQARRYAALTTRISETMKMSEEK